MENNITLNDLANVVNLVDIVTSRGAFKGEELVQVGTLREKFVSFVKAAQEAQNADVKEDDTEVPEDVEVEVEPPEVPKRPRATK